MYITWKDGNVMYDWNTWSQFLGILLFEWHAQVYMFFFFKSTYHNNKKICLFDVSEIKEFSAMSLWNNLSTNKKNGCNSQWTCPTYTKKKKNCIYEPNSVCSSLK